MSLAAMAWAWGQDVPKASAKLVLLCLADCQNSDTGACYPSHSHIAKQTGLNIKTVPGAVKYLEELGLVKARKQHGARTNYRLELHPKTGVVSDDDPDQELPKPPPKTGTPKNGSTPKNGYTQKRVVTTPKNGCPPPPKTGSEPVITSKEPKRYRSLSISEVPDFLVEPVCEFIDHRHNLKKPLTENALGRFLTAVDASSDATGLTPTEVITETIDAGWQSVKPEWLKNRLGVPNERNPNRSDQNPDRSAVGRVRERARAAGVDF